MLHAAGQVTLMVMLAALMAFSTKKYPNGRNAKSPASTGRTCGIGGHWGESHKLSQAKTSTENQQVATAIYKPSDTYLVHHECRNGPTSQTVWGDCLEMANGIRQVFSFEELRYLKGSWEGFMSMPASARSLTIGLFLVYIYIYRILHSRLKNGSEAHQKADTQREEWRIRAVTRAIIVTGKMHRWVWRWQEVWLQNAASETKQGNFLRCQHSSSLAQGQQHVEEMCRSSVSLA